MNEKIQTVPQFYLTDPSKHDLKCKVIKNNKLVIFDVFKVIFTK